VSRWLRPWVLGIGWMEQNGGKDGLRAAISQVADGTRRLP